MQPRLVLCFILVTLLAACSHDETIECPGGTRYQSAASAGALRIPDDLSVPDETDALQIPGSVAPPDPGVEVECLEYSPAFSEALEEE